MGQDISKEPEYQPEYGPDVAPGFAPGSDIWTDKQYEEHMSKHRHMAGLIARREPRGPYLHPGPYPIDGPYLRDIRRGPPMRPHRLGARTFRGQDLSGLYSAIDPDYERRPTYYMDVAAHYQIPEGRYRSDDDTPKGYGPEFRVGGYRQKRRTRRKKTKRRRRR